MSSFYVMFWNFALFLISASCRSYDSTIGFVIFFFCLLFEMGVVGDSDRDKGSGVGLANAGSY